MSRFKVFNFLKKQPVPDYKKDKSEGITTWEVEGGNNNFPQQLIQNVYDSPIGSAAMDIWHEFTNGAGFVDDIGSVKVNATETLEDFHLKISNDLSLMSGMAVKISYNAEGLPLKYEHMPFEETRLGELSDTGNASKIYHNPYYGIPQSYDKRYSTWYYTYNPDPASVREEIRMHNQLKAEGKIDVPYTGQVFWFSVEKPLSRVYPMPFYYSAINWFRIDKEIQQFHERNIKNNFLLSVILNVFGTPDQGAGNQDEDGNYESTLGEELNKQMKTFANGDGGAFVNWFTIPEEKATLESFPTNSNHELFIALQKLTAEQISIGAKVPPVLLSIREGGKLGDTQEILNAIRVMQDRTKRNRYIIESNYAKIFRGFKPLEGRDFTIKSINPINILPDWTIEVLTDQEKRDYINDNFNIDLLDLVKDTEQ